MTEPRWHPAGYNHQDQGKGTRGTPTTEQPMTYFTLSNTHTEIHPVEQNIQYCLQLCGEEEQVSTFLSHFLVLFLLWSLK